MLWALGGADSQGAEVTARSNALRKARLGRWGRSGPTDPRRSQPNELHDAAGRGAAALVAELIQQGAGHVPTCPPTTMAVSELCGLAVQVKT